MKLNHLKQPLVIALRFLKLDIILKDTLNRYSYFFNKDLKLRNARFETAGAPDHLPLPSAKLIYLVSGQQDMKTFYENGLLSSQCIQSILKKNNLRIENFHSVLDFGCGCGRVTRHWKSLKDSRMAGVDYNEDLIAWCQECLPFAKFAVNQSVPPLAFENSTFDFIYSISVFTHLDEGLQYLWMSELMRVLRPGGYLYITTHGKSRTGPLEPALLRDFESGKLVIVNRRYSGTNCCGTYHPESFIRTKLCKDLKVVDHIPEGARASEQDETLIQKPF